VKNKSGITFVTKSGVSGILVALFFAFQMPVLFASDPPENIRIEDDLLRWDPVEGAISYNIYATTTPVNGNGFYVTTVVDGTEFQPTFPSLYTVVSFFGGTPEEFSDVDAGEFVQFGDDPILTSAELFELLFPPVEQNSEVRTNRCTDIGSGQSCAVMCDADASWVATGGACRADSPIVLHQRAIGGGYECLATDETAYVEVDVICLRPEGF